MSDLRPGLTETFDRQRRERASTITWTAPIIGAVGAVMLLVTDGSPFSRIVSWFMLGFGVAMLGGGVVLRRAGRPPVTTRLTREGPVTEVARPTTEHAPGALMFVLLAAALGVGAVTQVRPEPWLAAALAVAAVYFGVGALAIVSGYFAAGHVRLSPRGLVYRSTTLESHIDWDDIEAAFPDEAIGKLRIVVYPGRQVRARLRGRLFKTEAPTGPQGAVLDVKQMALLPTDLARAVVHYAGSPASRAELGTDAATRRLAELAEEPIEVHSSALTVHRSRADEANAAVGSVVTAEVRSAVREVRIVYAVIGALVAANGLWIALASDHGFLVALGWVGVALGLMQVAAALPWPRRRATDRSPVRG